MNEEIIIRAKEVIDENWLPTYVDERDVIYSELFNLNMRIFLLEKIDDFPFHIFVPLYDHRIFWQQVRNSLIESAIMGAWRIVVDTNEDTLTLRRFKNDVFKNLRDEQQKRRLGPKIKAIDLDKRVSRLSDKIRYIRHNFIAHLNYNSRLEPSQQAPYDLSISLPEMHELLEMGKSLYDMLCFEEYHYIWLWAYADTPRSRRETDIDKLLDLMAENSYIIKSPENDPEYWNEKVQTLTSSDITTFNKYRRRFGLAEISKSDENS